MRPKLALPLLFLSPRSALPPRGSGGTWRSAVRGALSRASRRQSSWPSERSAFRLPSPEKSVCGSKDKTKSLTGETPFRVSFCRLRSNGWGHGCREFIQSCTRHCWWCLPARARFRARPFSAAGAPAWLALKLRAGAASPRRGSRETSESIV